VVAGVELVAVDVLRELRDVPAAVGGGVAATDLGARLRGELRDRAEQAVVAEKVLREGGLR
jgi:hypothetical protein